MNIRVIHENQHFSKNWNCQQIDSGLSRSLQSKRIEGGNYYPRHQHSYRDKETLCVVSKSERSSKDNQKGDKVTFGHKHLLKTSWLQGLLPNVKKGLYGDNLTKQNISLDHLLPISKGGKTELSNLALATKDNNSLRGNRDLKEILTRQQAMEYIRQFAPYKEFRQYITDVLHTFEQLGVIK